MLRDVSAEAFWPVESSRRDAVEFDSHDGLGREPGHQGIAPAVAEHVAAVDHKITRRDNGSPPGCGLVEFGTRIVVGIFPAIVVLAV